MKRSSMRRGQSSSMSQTSRRVLLGFCMERDMKCSVRAQLVKRQPGRLTNSFWWLVRQEDLMIIVLLRRKRQVICMLLQLRLAANTQSRSSRSVARQSQRSVVRLQQYSNTRLLMTDRKPFSVAEMQLELTRQRVMGLKLLLKMNMLGRSKQNTLSELMLAAVRCLQNANTLLQVQYRSSWILSKYLSPYSRQVLVLLSREQQPATRMSSMNPCLLWVMLTDTTKKLLSAGESSARQDTQMMSMLEMVCASMLEHCTFLLLRQLGRVSVRLSPMTLLWSPSWSLQMYISRKLLSSRNTLAGWLQKDLVVRQGCSDILIFFLLQSTSMGCMLTWRQGSWLNSMSSTSLQPPELLSSLIWAKLAYWKQSCRSTWISSPSLRISQESVSTVSAHTAHASSQTANNPFITHYHIIQSTSGLSPSAASTTPRSAAGTGAVQKQR